MATQYGTFSGSVAQGSNDTAIVSSIDTGISRSSTNVGISIVAVSAEWVNGATAVAADYHLAAVLSTVSLPTDATEANDDVIARAVWAGQNTAGTAVFSPVELQKFDILFQSRLTVQEQIFVNLISSNTGQMNNLTYKIYYETVKLSEIEFLRLAASGA